MEVFCTVISDTFSCKYNHTTIIKQIKERSWLKSEVWQSWTRICHQKRDWLANYPFNLVKQFMYEGPSVWSYFNKYKNRKRIELKLSIVMLLVKHTSDLIESLMDKRTFGARVWWYVVEIQIEVEHNLNIESSIVIQKHDKHSHFGEVCGMCLWQRARSNKR